LSCHKEHFPLEILNETSFRLSNLFLSRKADLVSCPEVRHQLRLSRQAGRHQCISREAVWVYPWKLAGQVISFLLPKLERAKTVEDKYFSLSP
jgi:hypothetical protein